MSEVDAKGIAAPDAAALVSEEKEHVSKETQPKASTGENPQGHPVREWIDTLLMAAVMAKGKKKNGQPSTAASIASETTEGGGRSEPASLSEGDQRKKATKTGPARGEEVEPLRADDDEELGNGQENGIQVDDDNKRYRRRRCEVQGCTKFARFNNACSGHGGRRLCSQNGCKRVAQFGHKCSAHGGIKYCSVEGCERAVQSRGFCKTHGGGVRCKHPGCDKGAISKGHCRAHGGGSRCAEEGCQKWAQRHGFCVRHSKTAAPSLEVKDEAPVLDTAEV